MSETRRIIELLRDHHDPKDGWATFVELRGGTGYSNQQGIDFFAMHTWPSKNFRSIAYEIKVSRNDFANEIKSPLKRAFAESVSHECLFVVPQGLVQVDEIPDGWGLMVANAGGLKTLKHGTQRTNIKWATAFMASIARRVADEPLKLPDAAWKVEGKEIGENELLAIAAQALSTTVKRQIDIEREAIKSEVMNSEEYRNATRLQYAVARAMGKYGKVTDKDFEEWLATLQRATPWDTRQIKNAIAMLQKLVGEEVSA